MTTTTNNDQTTFSGQRFLTPEEVGLLVKTLRSGHGWTQETIAELSGLQTRTIQRVEQGQPSNSDTRRALARAFGIEDLNYFNTLKSLPTAEEALRQKRNLIASIWYWTRASWMAASSLPQCRKLQASGQCPP
jgi:transcriptional regulator with XRE-family HTH domain